MHTPDDSPSSGVLDYHAVFDSLVAPKLVLSRDFVVVDVNDAYLSSRALTRERVLGRHVAEIDPEQSASSPDQTARVLAALARCLRTGRYELLEPHRADVVGRDGVVSRRFVLPTVVPVHSSTGEIPHLILRLQDVTSSFLPAPATGDVVRDPEQLSLRSTLERMGQTVARERRASLDLQGSILTPPPPTPGLTIAVRYQPAAQDVPIGGDWYDVVARPDGSTIIIVGDVTGHDWRAAATMAQLRGILRAVAYDSDGPPEDVVARAQRVARGLHVDAFAALTVCLVGPPAEDGARELRTVRVGALPPLARSSSGRVGIVAAPPAAIFGLDLGVDRGRGRTVLHPGSTVLLFTDGLLERPGEPLLTALERLRRAAEQAETDSPDGLCDALLQASQPRGGDDVALVAVRVEAPGTDTLES